MVSLSSIFLIYVDDIIVTGPDTEAISQLICNLQKDFALKDLGPLHYFLGVEALFDKHGLFLSQRRYITELLKKTNMLNANGVSSPMSSSASLSQFTGDAFSDDTLYRRVVGSLQYLSITRPDIAFAVGCVCQFMHRPTIPHWSAVKRILCYLKQTIIPFCSKEIPHIIFKPFQMRIGQVARMIDALLADIAYFLATTLFLGAPESRKPYPAQALK